MALQTPEFIEADYWARNRGRYLGLLIAVAVIVFGFLFFQRHRQARAAESWAAVVGEGGRTKAHIPLDGPVANSPAEPWALFQNAHSAFIEKDLEKAEQHITRLQNAYAGHVLNQDGRVQTLLDDIRAEKAWLAEHPAPESNPDVDEANTVTIQTSLGAVRIGLYADRAPEAVAAFLDLVREGGLESGSFHEAQRESWIAFSSKPPADEGGADEEEDEGEQEDDDDTEEDAGEPSKLAQGIVGDRNNLSHYAGAVSLLRGSAASLDADAVPRIAIYLMDSPHKGGQEVVFGQVQSGLDILSQASTRDLVGEGETELAEPLAIEGIEIGSGLTDL